MSRRARHTTSVFAAPLGLLIVLVLAVPPLGGAARAEEPQGLLALTVLDGGTGELTPARVEVADEAGGLHVPQDALPAPGRCSGGSEPAWYASLAEGSVLPETLWVDMHVQEPGTNGRHFSVLGGRAELELPPGRYRVTAFKGLEYTERSATVDIAAGERADLALVLERFVDLPAEGWFAADDHVHVARHDPVVNPLLATWVEAEDLHVANLLEMGTYVGTEAAAQYAFGRAGLYQRGRTIIAPGQENPRTWTLGHGIVLGASTYIDFPDRYLDYRSFWAEAARQRARTGHAHWGGPAWPVDLPRGELDFLEVLQIDIGLYDDLYLAWDLGFRIAPTAGTDYQCTLSGPPGLVRFYTRVEPPLTYEKWLAALGAGRTFVTNGPFVELEVDGSGIGSAIELAAPGDVAVDATVRFDPSRDRIDALEIVRGGEVVQVVDVPDAPGVLRFSGPLPVDEPTWFAARVRGSKLGRGAASGARRASLAHTGAVFVGIDGVAAERTAARRAARRRALEGIDALAATLDELRARPVISVWLNQFDSATLRRDWPLLQEAIEAARDYYERGDARRLPRDVRTIPPSGTRLPRRGGAVWPAPVPGAGRSGAPE